MTTCERQQSTGRQKSVTAQHRDAYGFEVKKEYLQLYRKYAPLWEKEESERKHRWACFLSGFDGGSEPLLNEPQQTDALAALELALLQWQHSEQSKSTRQPPDWWQQLRSLVQAGIPMALRGRMWKVFLKIEAKRSPGTYDRLVLSALAPQYQNSKKLGEPLPHEEAGLRTAYQERSQSVLKTTDEEDLLAASANSSQGPAQQPDAAMADPDAGPQQAQCTTSNAADAPQLSPSNGAGTLSLEETAELNSAVSNLLLSLPPASVNDPKGSTPAESSKGSAHNPQWHPSSHDWNVQIEKDLHRTFPGHPVMDRSGRRSLRRILAAYACRNPSVGYCQGMNFVAGCLLLFMEEEDAFWSLTAIVEDLLPGYFSMAMVAPQVDQLVFKHMVDAQFPKLTAHLDDLGVNVASVSTQWFLCMFVNSLPLETCLRVWDIFFFEECSSVLFRMALALVDIYSQALIATVDSVDAFSLLQNMAPLSFDSSRLVDVGSIAYSNVDHEHMQGLRDAFTDVVRAQFEGRMQRAAASQATRAVAASEIAPVGVPHSDDVERSFAQEPALAEARHNSWSGKIRAGFTSLYRRTGSQRSDLRFPEDVQAREPGADDEETEETTSLEPEHLSALAEQTAAAGQRLPRIQVSFLEGAQGIPRLDLPFEYRWQSAHIPLHLDSSRAAAAAYEIASTPAAPLLAASSDATVSGRDRWDRGVMLPARCSAELQPGTEDTGAGKAADGVSGDWDHAAGRKEAVTGKDAGEVQMVPSSRRLGTRKADIFPAGVLSDEARDVTLQQLMSTVEGLEEELFQAEARRHDAEIAVEALRATAEELRAKLNGNADAIRSKQGMLMLLRERYDDEAALVASGEARRQDHRAGLHTAQAHAALKASLLAEKEELIAALLQQTGQGTVENGAGLFRKLGFRGRQRVIKPAPG